MGKSSINNVYSSIGMNRKSFILIFILLFITGFVIGLFISQNKEEIYQKYTINNKEKIDNYIYDNQIEELDIIDTYKVNKQSIENQITNISDTFNNTNNLKTIEQKKDNHQKQDKKKLIFTKKKIDRNLPKWQVNSLSFIPRKNIPMIAIIIDDMGLDIIRSNKILDINAPLTTSYMTYAINLNNQIKNAQKKGKEIMLHVPMEAKNEAYDAGPDVLKTSYDTELLQEIIKKQISKSNAIVGINNHMGSKFTENFAAMNTILEPVKDAGLIFIDSKTSQKSVGAKVAKVISMPYAARDIFLDHYPEEKEIEQQLKMLEIFAKHKGYAIAIGHPRDNTINVLTKWIQNIEKHGFQIVPITTIIKHINKY